MGLLSRLAAAGTSLCIAGAATAGTIQLYDQNFENPNGFNNGFGSGYADLSQQEVNDLYSTADFQFEQTFTVETILLTGSAADGGNGYDDTTGQGGNYAIGMLGPRSEDDRLGLSFDAQDFDFFNFKVDISSVGLYVGPGSPFTTVTDVPKFRFTLYDNPTGLRNLSGNGTVLDSGELVGLASPINELVWTTGTFAFDASGSSNGNVTLQVDVFEGGYAAMDNWLITASDEAGGGLNTVPLPGGMPLLLAGLSGLALMQRRRKAS